MAIPDKEAAANLGDRLRYLRGEETQEEFSERLAVSRSSLASWETGRTKPRRKVLREISLKLGVSESFLTKGEAIDARDLANGLNIALHGPTDFTADEATIVRILRLCSPETALAVAQLLTDEVEQNEAIRQMIDPLTAIDDLTRLYRIQKLGGFYERGMTEQNLDQLISELARKNQNK